VSNDVCDATDDECHLLVGAKGKIRWASITPYVLTDATEAAALCKRTVAIFAKLHMESCQSRKARTTCLAGFLNVGGEPDSANEDFLDVAFRQARAEQGMQKRIDAAQEQRRADATYSDVLTRRLLMEWSDSFSEASIRKAIAEVGLDMDAAVEWLLNHGNDVVPESNQKCVLVQTEQARGNELPALPSPGASRPTHAHALSITARRAQEASVRDNFWASRKERQVRVACSDRAQQALRQSRTTRTERGRKP
jgi:hypothetical protein